MTAEKLFALAADLLKEGMPGRLNCVIKFKDPTNRINLPLFSDGKNGREFIRYKKGNDCYYLVMSHAQTINQFEEALFASSEEGKTQYPEVTINYKKAGIIHNLIQEPHRMYSAFLTQPHEKIFVLLNNKSWPETEKGKSIYDINPIKRIKAVVKYSPLTILFGGWGSWKKQSSSPKYTSLVEAEIVGMSLSEENISTRRGAGSYMPPLGVHDDQSVVLLKGVKSSELGLNTVPLNLFANRGAVALKNIQLEANLILDRLCLLRMETPEESLYLKVYMLALWLHMWWLSYKRGYSHYQGRELIADSYEFSLFCPPPFKPELAKELKNLNPEICAKFYQISLDRMVNLGLIDLTPLKLVASPELDEAILDRESKKSKKDKAKQSENK